MAESPCGGSGQTVDQPGLAIIVVHGEGAIGLQPVAHRLHRFLGKEEGLQADLRGAADQGERVRQGKQDEVVLAIARLQEGAAVVDVPTDPRVRIGPVDIIFGADRHDPGIDVDRVDPMRTLAKRNGDVRSRPRADDQQFLQLVVGKAEVGSFVDPLALFQLPFGRCHQLMRHAIGLDGDDAVLCRPDDLGVDLVIRRPAHAGRNRLDQEQADERRGIAECHEAAAVFRQQQVQRPCDDAPHQRRRLHEAKRRESDDADQRADQIVAIGRQRPQPGETAPH